MPAAQAALEHEALQQPAEPGHDRQRRHEREERRDVGSVREHDQTRNAASTARSPCARLMMRMTPNIKDRPHAISA